VSKAIISIGNVLFRFRSFTPVPVLLFLAYRLWATRSGYGPGGPDVDLALNWAGLLCASLGQALRFYTLGQVPEGTSGQRDVLEAWTLNTQGPYAYVRNPLYVGNLGITLGLLLVANDVWTYVIGLGFFFGEYFFIIRAEENFLRGRFNELFDAFCRKVPRWVPRLSPAYEGKLRSGFDTKRALKKEHNPFAAWASGALGLWAWELHARGELTHDRATLLLALEACVLLFFIVVKAYKRGWLSLRSV
jgi:hypothetical protein